MVGGGVSVVMARRHHNLKSFGTVRLRGHLSRLDFFGLCLFYTFCYSRVVMRCLGASTSLVLHVSMAAKPPQSFSWSERPSALVVRLSGRCLRLGLH